MTDIQALSNETIEQQLASVPQWQLKDGKLYRRLVFDNFVAAFGFMAQVAILAEKANHHPEWANVYRTVDIFLTTHEVDGISVRDFALAQSIDKLISS